MKVCEILERADGSQVKVVAEEGFGTGLHRSIGVYVLRRANENQPWKLCSDKPDPNWRSMSVTDYVRRGRSEMLQTVSTGEIFKVVQRLDH